MEFAIIDPTTELNEEKGTDAGDTGELIASLIDLCHGLGLQAITAHLPRNADGTFNFPVMAEIVRCLTAEGIRAVYVGAFPSPASVTLLAERLTEDAATRRAVNQRAAQDIARVGEIGVPMIGVHCAMPLAEDPVTYQKSLDVQMAAFEVIVPAAEKAGVVLAVHPRQGSMHNTFTLYRGLLDAFPSRYLGLCYDPLTTTIDGRPTNNRQQWESADNMTPLDLLNDRLVYAHIRNQTWSETRGRPVHDRLATGPVDELAVLRKLRAVGYDGIVQLEHIPGGAVGYALALGYLRGLVRAGFDDWHEVRTTASQMTVEHC